MKPEYVEIKFVIKTQAQGNGQFSIPAEVCRLLNLQAGDDISLVITKESGERIGPMVKKLSSSTEIYGEGISGVLDSGEEIIVTASQP